MSRARIAIVVHATYPQDTRVRRQAEALVAAGHEADIFALRTADQPAREEADGIRIRRLPLDRKRHGMIGHLAEYLAFLGLAAAALIGEHRRRRYRLIQIANVPDFLVLAGLPMRLRGVPLLLDLHEDMPAFYRDRFRGPLAGPLHALVTRVARGSAAVADRIITVHEPLRRLAIRRGISPDRIEVVMNSADERIFDPARFPRREFMADGELRLIHHSNLQRIYGLEFAIAALARLGQEVPELAVRLDVYGDGPYRPAIEATIDRTGTADRVHLHGAVPLDALPELLAGADIGLVPTRDEPYSHYSLSTKLLEYAAMGVPIIASELATFRAHFDDRAIRYVSPEDPAALADAIRADLADPAAAAARGAEARRQYAAYAWPGQRELYLAVVDSLLARGR